MNHPEVRRRMGEYLQGDLTLSQRALFDAHLDGCGECAGELRTLRETVHLLRELPTPEVPPHLADRVVARIADGEGQARPWDGLLAFWDWIDPARYLPPLAAAALTSALVIVGVRDYGLELPGLQAPPAAPADLHQADAAPDTRLPPTAPPLRRDTATAERPVLRGAAPAAAAAGEEVRSGPEELHDPLLFLARYRALQAERREAWLRQIAAQAAHERQVADVARRLRESAGPEGRDLADRFEAVAYPAGR